MLTSSRGRKIEPFLLENDPETILEQRQSAVERVYATHKFW